MYELTCPLCHHKMRTPYLRKGAVAKCLKCRYTFTVEESHYVLRKPLRAVSASTPTVQHAAAGAATANTVKPVPAASQGGPSSETSSASPPSPPPPQELSPESPQPRSPAQHDTPDPIKSRIHIVQHEPPPPSHSRVASARRRARKNNWWTVAGLAAVLVLVATGVFLIVQFGPTIGPRIGGVVANQHVVDQAARGSGPSHQDSTVAGDSKQTATKSPGGDPKGIFASPSPTNPPQRQTSHDGRSVDAEPKAQRLSGVQSVVQQAMEAANREAGTGGARFFDVPTELLEQDLDTIARAGVEPITAPAWQLVDEPYLPPVHIGPIQVTDSRLAAGGNGELRYTAQVTCTKSKLYPQASVTLAIVSLDQRVTARMKVDAAMLRADRPRTLDLTVPADLALRTLQVAWTANGGRPAKPEQVIETVLVEANNEGPQTVLRMIVYNSTDRTYFAARFLVAAMDPEGKTLARWRVDWPQIIEPGQRLVFAAETPLEDEWDVRSWDVIGLGQTDLSKLPPPATNP